MKATSKKTNLIKKSLQNSLISSCKDKGNLINNKINLLINDKKEKEKEEFGYELHQSYDTELNLEKENKARSSLHQKSNGEDLEKYSEKIILNQINKNKDSYILEYNNFINNSQNNKNEINLENNNYLSENKNIKKTVILQQILLVEMKKEIENLKIEKKNIIEKYEMRINNILTEKNQTLKNKIESNIKDEIIKLDNGTKNSEGINNNYNQNEEEFKLIDKSYGLIKQTSDNLKIIFENNYLKNQEIIPTNLKNFIEHINFDNNGNISIHDKLLVISEFNNIINLEIKILLDKLKNNLLDINIKNNINKDDINNNVINLYNSENGQNNKITSDKNKIFKKIDAIINKNRLITPNNINNYLSKSRGLIKNTNRLKILNRSRENNLNSININNKNLFNIKNSLFEKNSIVYKSNLSPMNNKSLNTSYNNNFSSKYNKLINILNDNNKKTKLKKLKTMKINELNKLIINNTSSNKLLDKENTLLGTNSFFKNIKNIKIPIPSSLKINKTANVNTIKKDLFSLSNFNSKKNNINSKQFRPIYKNKSGFNNINSLNDTLDKIPYLSNYKSINFKRKIILNNDLNNRKVERNKFDKLDYNKTDIKNNAEYIKINDIFKNLNDSNKFSKSSEIESHKEVQTSKNIDAFKNKLINNSFLDEENRNENINNNNKKFFSKKILNQQKLKKQIIGDINGLSNEIKKSAILKNNISINLK